MVETAIQNAKAGSRLRTIDVELAPRPTRGNGVQVRYETPVAVDPFRIKPSELQGYVRDWESLLLHARNRSSHYICLDYMTGTEFLAIQENGERQYFIQVVSYIEVEGSVFLEQRGESQIRSFRFGNAGGFEFIKGLDIPGHCRRIVEEAEQLMRAPECKEGVYDVIIMPDQLGLHVHETVHGLEGDRFIGGEMTYMGNSMLGDPKILPQIGSFRFASPAVTLVTNATLPGGYGTYGFDHDGIPAENTSVLINAGKWQGLLLSREVTQPLNRLIGRDYFHASNGMCRAESYERIPLVRMANTMLMPGPHSTDDLIAGIDRGLILDGNQSWSMEFDRGHFSFGQEIGYLIRGGKIQHVVRNPGYMGNTLNFWRSCDAVGREGVIYNEPNCGKALPGQTVSTGHWTPPALFRNVHVLNRKKLENGGGA